MNHSMVIQLLLTLTVCALPTMGQPPAKAGNAEDGKSSSRRSGVTNATACRDKAEPPRPSDHTAHGSLLQSFPRRRSGVCTASGRSNAAVHRQGALGLADRRYLRLFEEYPGASAGQGHAAAESVRPRVVSRSHFRRSPENIIRSGGLRKQLSQCR